MILSLDLLNEWSRKATNLRHESAADGSSGDRILSVQATVETEKDFCQRMQRVLRYDEKALAAMNAVLNEYAGELVELAAWRLRASAHAKAVEADLIERRVLASIVTGASAP